MINRNALVAGRINCSAFKNDEDCVETSELNENLSETEKRQKREKNVL